MAIAGFGVVGKKRYEILKKIKEVNIVAISDKDIENSPKNKNIEFFSLRFVKRSLEKFLLIRLKET